MCYLIFFMVLYLQKECVKLQCTDSNDCPSSKTCFDNQCVDPCSLANVCGEFTNCVSSNHIGLCSCQPGYTGDPRLGCVPVQYCSHDTQCSAGTRCNNGICTGKYFIDFMNDVRLILTYKLY